MLRRKGRLRHRDESHLHESCVRIGEVNGRGPEAGGSIYRSGLRTEPWGISVYKGWDVKEEKTEVKTGTEKAVEDENQEKAGRSGYLRPQRVHKQWVMSSQSIGGFDSQCRSINILIRTGPAWINFHKVPEGTSLSQFNSFPWSVFHRVPLVFF